ncbi:MAG: hypothetical protein JWR18_1548, partial [Segetibacter sp.]|nr:hypothetical protein [Segetibacter sp.]
MLVRKSIAFGFFLTFSFINLPNICIAQVIIKNDQRSKTITFGNKKIKLTVDYKDKANVAVLEVNVQKVIEGTEVIYSSIKTTSAT